MVSPGVFSGNDFGLKWNGNVENGMGYFPQYFKDSADFRVAIPESELPPETRLKIRDFRKPNENPSPYHAELRGAWRTPGPVAGPFYADLIDNSRLVYFWYRFIDQPVFQQFNWSESKKDSLQSLIEKMHVHWTLDQNYMREPSSGELVAFDPALFVTPPPEYAVGYVPIVLVQEKSEGSGVENIEGEHTPDMIVFPNPARESIFVTLPESYSVEPQLLIVNMKGQVIQEMSVSKRLESLDISKLPGGTYLLVHKDGDRYEQTRFVKVE